MYNNGIHYWTIMLNYKNGIGGVYMLMNVSVLLLIISVLFKVFKPKKRNCLYGYRTTLSKSSQKMWDEAQRYSSTILIIVSCILLVLGLLLKNLTFQYDIEVNLVLILTGLASIFIFTEKHLKGVI